MTYELLIGQRLYSSWSLRGWLCFDAFDIPCRVETVEIYSDGFSSRVADFAGGTSVPAVITPEGGRLTDTLAIAWHLAEAFPDRGLLPEAPTERAMARSMIAEMHSGFAALRRSCPMDLSRAWIGFVPDADVRADLDRIEGLWAGALDISGGPFLFGAYTLADAFFAPVAARIAGFGIEVSPSSWDYVAAHLDHASFRRWRALGLAENRWLSVYDQPFEAGPFPAPASIAARDVETR
ncbi:glutathione S-transferase [Ponticoccus sp. SC2-23]|uniref:glutathione S-transferase n=1 Tax=Alexandriicola marinus TaxID=2081710 RepID=UPI00193B5DC5|nr:glutathione S-transferase [Alexandriicola marinus]MBM1220135.1 glutathione S-transferase [Ponticoccus sp. SC6-9]MBM1224821.1 glutathione S-transferase [Ponticoccus sp. SC6-15]MBM1228335.1 glutathione S-transferase [Ponticoccus sp. SC6-38]MBM1234028.1 glutathione S-transferase [Ponticoccus sp. SC6-45]MBM1238836.1 glutathione S-transferase [Ponticoccus sp. SC6-49]MBM1242618.1 glutathione S-transferase [Ponticoccus sp. SC2-64]MBM1247552.1 glutathione S-transferase [Ponticoccus sp. SC6-42]MB